MAPMKGEGAVYFYGPPEKRAWLTPGF